MLPDMHNIQGICIYYVEVGWFEQYEHCKISMLTITSLGLVVIVTIHHRSVVTVWIMQDSRDALRQSLADIISVEKCCSYI
jgi:hypothetical protein